MLFLETGSYLMFVSLSIYSLRQAHFVCVRSLPPSPREWWEKGGVSTDPMVSGHQLCFRRPTEKQKGLWDVISKRILSLDFLPFAHVFLSLWKVSPNAVFLALASFLSVRPGDSVPQLGGNRGDSQRPLIKWGCVFCFPRPPVTLQPC